MSKLISPTSAEDMPEYEPSRQIWARLPRTKAGEATLTDELIGAFETLLLEGNTRTNATRILGLQRTTLSEWIKQGRKDIAEGRTTLHSRLLWAIDRGEGEQERRLTRAATKAAHSPTTEGALALKILERRNPDEWAPAVPELQSPESQYMGLSAQALREEARKILEGAAREVKELPPVAEESEDS